MNPNTVLRALLRWSRRPQHLRSPESRSDWSPWLVGRRYLNEHEDERHRVLFSP